MFPFFFHLFNVFHLFYEILKNVILYYYYYYSNKVMVGFSYLNANCSKHFIYLKICLCFNVSLFCCFNKQLRNEIK